MRGAYYPQMPADTSTVSGEFVLKNRYGNVIRQGEFHAPSDGLTFDAERAIYTPPLGELRDTDALTHVWSS